MATPSRLPSTRRPPGAAAGRSRPTSMIEPGFSGLPTPTKTSPKSKRMSLLPQFSRTSSAEHKEQSIVERENQDPESSRMDGAGIADAEAFRQADRKAMPPPASKLSRAPSTRVPGSSQLGRAPSVRSHARTQSTQSNPSPRPESQGNSSASSAINASRRTATDTGLKRTPSTTSSSPATRQTGVARSTSVRTSQAPTHIRNNSATTPTSLSGVRRTNSVRPPSVNTSISSQAPPAPSPTSPRKATELHRPASKFQMLPPPKPSFSTYQQHYSPAKTALPKPPVPTSRQARPAPPSLEEDTSIPFDVLKQQIELLQLALLHEASTRTLSQYSADAKSKIGKRHGRLRKEYEAVHATETSRQKLENLGALQAWCPEHSLLVENLQVLARVHKDVAAITHPESRYTELLHVFEQWVSVAEETMASGARGFVEGLPGSWREAHASTALKIRSLQREMATLPSLPNQGSEDQSKTSLYVILTACRSLVDGILRELDMMATLEKELLGQEKSRIDNAVGDLDLKQMPISSWKPAWQKAM